MALALLARPNEPHWGETGVYMRNPYPNSNPNKPPGRATNPNPSSGHLRLIPRDYDEPPPVTVAVSDDSSSLDRRRDVAASVGYVTFNLSEYSRKELGELKRRLVAELELVRAVAGQIESKEVLSYARSVAHSVSGANRSGGREVTSPGQIHSRVPSVTGSDPFLERLGRRALPDVPAVKDWKNDAVVLPALSMKGTKRLAEAPESEKLLSDMMVKCKQILERLLKQKNSSWFGNPVDVEGMNLHDYHLIIKQPMDLGTVKSNLHGGLYRSPIEFAAHVRLTFSNALLYNPQGHVVNTYAGQLLHLFESEFLPAYAKYEKNLVAIVKEEEERQKAATWSHPAVPNTARTKAEHVPTLPRSAPVPAILPQYPAAVPPPAAVTVHSMHQSQQAPQMQSQQQQKPISIRPEVVGNLPKSMVKDLNKRPMSYVEKGKLGEALQTLPQEKMAQVLEIVRRRNSQMVQHGDEIELDFEVMDTETLWELDRFVNNCKKLASKVKRQEAPLSNNPSPMSLVSMAAEVSYKPSMRGEMADAVADILITRVEQNVNNCKKLASKVKRQETLLSNPSPMPLVSMAAEVSYKPSMRGEMADALADILITRVDHLGEEDVDIGENLPSANYPPVEIEKDNAGSSGSSDSDSSSSSDSGSESSSGNDSDEDDDNRDPAVGYKSAPEN